MKQFAKHFFSVLLLLSPLGVYGACPSSCSLDLSCTSSSSTCSSCPSLSSQCISTCSVSPSLGCSSTSSGCNDCGSTLILPRPQGVDGAMYYNPYYYSADLGDTCWTLDVGYRFEQSFKGERLARCLFGESTLTFSGTAVNPLDNTEFIADYFGLGRFYHGSVKFRPRIQSNVVNFGLTAEMGNWWDCLEGMYMQFNATLVNTVWNLRPCVTETATSSTLSNNADPGCYMNSLDVTIPGTLPGPGTPAFNGGEPLPLLLPSNTTSDLRTALNGQRLFGDMQSEWHYGRFNWNPMEITRVANIDVILGYDFLRCESYHLGAYVKTTAPTGNRPLAEYVFEPIAGNGHHWELGGGLTSHWEFWNCDDQALSFHLYGFVTHLFKDRQWRSFDFKDNSAGESGCMSRYVLLKEITTDGDYAGQLINAINFNTRKIKSSFAVQGEATLRLQYRNAGWMFGAGYNVWGRTRETLSDVCCYCPTARTYGIKGDAGLCYITATGVEQPLNATEDDARIGVTAAVDNAVDLAGTTGWDGAAAVASQTAAGANDPVTVNCAEDFNFARGAIPSQMTNKFFISLDYQFQDCEYLPYLGIGGEAEFAGHNRGCTENKWGIWLRGGMSF